MREINMNNFSYSIAYV